MFGLLYMNETLLVNDNEVLISNSQLIKDELATKILNDIINNVEYEDYNNLEKNKTTCTINGEVYIDETRRKCETYTTKYNIYSRELNKLFNNNKYKFSNFELLRYNENGFFKIHRDKKHNDYVNYEHTHSILLYPPNNLSPYEEGYLIINENKKEKIINPSSFTDWTFVIFNINTPHEASPVKNGTKYVFKGSIYTTLLTDEDTLED